MLRDFLRYFTGIIYRPLRTLEEMVSNKQILKHGLVSYVIYSVYYTLFVVYGYIVLNQSGFQYQAHYPNYPSPYYWEAFMMFPLFLVQWLILSLVTFFGTRLFHGKGTFIQTLGVLGVASFVPQFVVFALVDTPNALLMPQSIVEFATAGDPTKNVSIYGPPGSFVRQIADSYLYVALIWALVLSALAVGKVHKISFWKALPFVFLGMVWVLLVIILTKDYVILLW